jgi:hypothetical protein
MLSAEAKNYDEEILQAKLNALILLKRVHQASTFELLGLAEDGELEEQLKAVREFDETYEDCLVRIKRRLKVFNRNSTPPGKTKTEDRVAVLPVIPLPKFMSSS